MLYLPWISFLLTLFLDLQSIPGEDNKKGTSDNNNLLKNTEIRTDKLVPKVDL